ncbi:MAG: hypothetical protein ACYCW6_14800 [Candidatus Xenobia bacterium]
MTEPTRKDDILTPPPITTLSGDTLETYIQLVERLLNAGRLNKFYPDPVKVAALYHFMRPSQNFGLYKSARIDLRTGLPGEAEVSNILTDAALSAKVLGEATEAELKQDVESSGSQAATRRLTRWRYHNELSKAAMPPSFDLSLALRTPDPATKTAYFTVTFDRFDMADAVFVRYTILLSHTHNRWGRALVELVGDDLKYTESFRNVISRFAADEAEFAYLLLSDLPNIKVESVVRGRIGPLYFRGMQVLESWAGMFERNPAAFLMHFPKESAGRDVAQDGSNDPLSVLYRQFLSPEARAPVEARAKQLGYKVWKERKFSCTPDLIPHLKELLNAGGYRCLVTPI